MMPKTPPTLPISSVPLNGILHIQDPKKPWSSWEFYVGDEKEYHKYGVNKNELNKLSSYPITHLIYPEGIEITIKNGEGSCQAAFHAYNPNARGGRHIYIGSRGKRGRIFTKQYRAFLKKFGVNIGVQVNPIPAELDFRDGNIVYVFRRCGGGNS